MSFSKIKHPNDLDRFLYDSLIVKTQQWDVKDGRLNPIIRPDIPESLIGFEPGLTLPYEKALLRSLRWGLWRLIDDNLFLGKRREESQMLNNLTPLSPERELRLVKVAPYADALKSLCMENDASHSESYYVLGQYFELKKVLDEALRYYERALAILEPIAKSHPTIYTYSDYLHSIREAISRVRSKQEFHHDYH
jgi:tetratricopeptide (TPR) repeat protein